MLNLLPKFLSILGGRSRNRFLANVTDKIIIISILFFRPSDRPSLKVVRDKLGVILDIIIKAYNWKIKDPASLMKILNLDDSKTH